MKRTAGIVLVVFILAGVMGALAPTPAAQAEMIEASGNPLQMVLTETGGVTLNLSGITKYFKVWNINANTLTRVNIPYDNILSYDVDGNMLYFIVNAGSYTQVYQHDFSSGANKQLTTSFTNKREIQAAGGRLAWFDYGDSSLYIRDLSTGAETVIQVPASADVELSLTDSYLAYTAHDTAQSSVLLYSFATGKSTSLKAGPTIKSGVYMQGHRVVWVEGGGPINSGLGYYNLMWGNYVGKDPNATSGTLATDNKSRHTTNKVYCYDVLTGETKLLSNNDVNNLQPVVWENYAAWAQTYDGIPEIVLMDLNTGVISRITNNDYNDVMPAMDHGRLTYITIRGITGDLGLQYLTAAPPAPVVGDAIPVYINSVALVTDQPGYIKNNRTMIPMRAIFQALGAAVTWNESERSVTAVKGDTTIKLYIDQTTAYKNGQPVLLEAAPEIVAATARTMVPIRFVSEALGCTANWDEAARTVYISY